MSWVAFGVLRLSVTSAAMATIWWDLDWLWLRLPVVVAGLLMLTLGSRKLRAERQDRALLIRALALRNPAARSSPPAAR